MKDVSTPIINAFYSLLNGNVTYANKTVKVFKRPPKDTEIPIVKGALYHYIEIGDISDTEAPRNADVYVHDCTVDLQVIVGFPGIGDISLMNNIVNQVLQLIQTGKGSKITLAGGFTNIMIEKEIDFQTQEQDIHKKLIKTIRYRLEIDET